MMTVRKGRGGAGASAVEALGRRRSVRGGMGGCSVVRTGGSVEVTPSRSGRSDATGGASNEGVVGPLTHVVSSAPLVAALEVVKVDGVLGYSDVFLDDRIETSSEVHDVESCVRCSGEVDQLLEVVDVFVDGLPTLVVSSRYERCERDCSFVLWAELLLKVLEEGSERGEGEGAKLSFGAEEALGEDSSASGLHVRQDPSYFLLVILDLGLTEGKVELTRGQEGPAFRSVAVKGLGGRYLQSGALWNGRGRWGK